MVAEGQQQQGMQPPRTFFPYLSRRRLLAHNAEHMVLDAPGVPAGQIVYAILWHICPAAALHSEVVVGRPPLRA